MTYLNASNLRKNLFESFANVVEYNDRIRVSIKDSNVIILSEDEYNGMVETLGLCADPAKREKLKEGLQAKPQDWVKFEW